MNSQSISLEFVTLDVFTSATFSGNPLAIVLLPPPTEFAPSQDQLQSIAKEFNLSETVFLEQRTSEDQENAVQRIRIFTTTREIGFAGHPTIGATTWCLIHDPNLSKSSAIQSIVTKAGPIPIALIPSPETSQHSFVSALVPHNVCIHKSSIPAATLLETHPTIAPHLTAQQRQAGFPVVSIVHGMTAVLVELPSLPALAAARLGGGSPGISMKSVSDGGFIDDGWGVDASCQVYFFVREQREGEVETIRSRMMVRDIEDPATGSGASCMTVYLALQEVATKGRTREWKVVQGVEMGRRSEIGVKVSVKEDGVGVDTVQLTGCAVVVTEGKLHV